MNLEASFAKAVSLIEQTANKGAKFVAFGERQFRNRAGF